MGRDGIKIKQKNLKANYKKPGRNHTIYYDDKQWALIEWMMENVMGQPPAWAIIAFCIDEAKLKEMKRTLDAAIDDDNKDKIYEINNKINEVYKKYGKTKTIS